MCITVVWNINTFLGYSTEKIRRTARCNRKCRATSSESKRGTETIGGCSGSEKGTQRTC